MLAAALFVIWMVFNGRLTWELVAFGAVLSVLLSWFVTRFVATGFTPKVQLYVFRRLPSYLRYIWLLIKEITLANLAVMRLILTDRDIVVPKLATFRTPLHTMPARVMLADCVTLTPGTITVHLQGDKYLVHCLDEAFEEGLVNSAFEQRLMAMEKDWQEASL
ncbi:MAG: Na+/H+ antiporter subunit E [Clostridiales bacterium]|nr:Na+/H+ antiporter subunit E [Clostridiales bacterium]